MNIKELKYNLQPVHLDADKPEDVDFPSLRDRIIEKRGDVYTFSLSQIDNDTVNLLKYKKENEAKLKHEQAIIDNIEKFHGKLVKKLTDQELLTIWMYKQSKGQVDLCNKTIGKIDAQLQEYKEEVEEIMKQIPELKETKSADIVDEKVVLVEPNK